MAASIKGKTVSWGVPSGVITGTHSVTTSGIVQSFSVQRGGETELIKDEDGEVVSRVDVSEANKVSLEVVCEDDSVIPAKGDELTGIGTIDGINFSAGRVFVDEAQVAYSNGAVKKITVSATHYPAMPADG